MAQMSPIGLVHAVLELSLSYPEPETSSISGWGREISGGSQRTLSPNSWKKNAFAGRNGMLPMSRFPSSWNTQVPVQVPNGLPLTSLPPIDSAPALAASSLQRSAPAPGMNTSRTHRLCSGVPAGYGLSVIFMVPSFTFDVR